MGLFGWDFKNCITGALEAFSLYRSAVWYISREIVRVYIFKGKKWFIIKIFQSEVTLWSHIKCIRISNFGRKETCASFFWYFGRLSSAIDQSRANIAFSRKKMLNYLKIWFFQRISKNLLKLSLEMKWSKIWSIHSWLSHLIWYQYEKTSRVYIYFSFFISSSCDIKRQLPLIDCNLFRIKIQYL